MMGKRQASAASLGPIGEYRVPGCGRTVTAEDPGEEGEMAALWAFSSGLLWQQRVALCPPHPLFVTTTSLMLCPHILHPE